MNGHGRGWALTDLHTLKGKNMDRNFAQSLRSS
jgi:hypothetical protein